MDTLKDKIFYTSWGYNMTLVDFIKVIEETEKSVKCVMLGIKIENDFGGGNGRAYPTNEIESQPFRLLKKKYSNGDIYLRGSYPYCNGSKRKDSFTEYRGGGSYYNSWD